MDRHNNPTEREVTAGEDSRASGVAAAVSDVSSVRMCRASSPIGFTSGGTSAPWRSPLKTKRTERGPAKKRYGTRGREGL